jgi:hypothetical protein
VEINPSRVSWGCTASRMRPNSPMSASVFTGADSWVGSFDLGRDARDLFGVASDNILLIKVKYRLNP